MNSSTQKMLLCVASMVVGGAIGYFIQLRVTRQLVATPVEKFAGAPLHGGDAKLTSGQAAQEIATQIERLEKLKSEIYGNHEYVLVPRRALSTMIIATVENSQVTPDFIELAALTPHEVEAANAALKNAKESLDTARANLAQITVNPSGSFIIRVQRDEVLGMKVRRQLMADLQSAMSDDANDMFRMVGGNSLDQAFDHFMQYEEEREVSRMPRSDSFLMKITSTNSQDKIKAMNTIVLQRDQLSRQLTALKLAAYMPK